MLSPSALALNKSPDKLHLATGVTLAAACLNIGDCNGFGLEHIFRGRCRWGKFKNNTCLFIKSDTGEKIVIFSGGGKSDSYKKIRGNSYGMWIATEINKHYISPDDDCFIKEAFNRQLVLIEECFGTLTPITRLIPFIPNISINTEISVWMSIIVFSR